MYHEEIDEMEKFVLNNIKQVTTVNVIDGNKGTGFKCNITHGSFEKLDDEQKVTQQLPVFIELSSAKKDWRIVLQSMETLQHEIRAQKKHKWWVGTPEFIDTPTDYTWRLTVNIPEMYG